MQRRRLRQSELVIGLNTPLPVYQLHYVKYSDLKLPDYCDEIIRNSQVTWGTADHTLIGPDELAETLIHGCSPTEWADTAFTDGIAQIDAISENLLIDMES